MLLIVKLCTQVFLVGKFYAAKYLLHKFPNECIYTGIIPCIKDGDVKTVRNHSQQKAVQLSISKVWVAQ